MRIFALCLVALTASIACGSGDNDGVAICKRICACDYRGDATCTNACERFGLVEQDTSCGSKAAKYLSCIEATDCNFDNSHCDESGAQSCINDYCGSKNATDDICGSAKLPFL